MTKIVYNACYGGFSLSNEAVMRYAEITGVMLYAKKSIGYYMYATVPWDEFEKIADEEKKKPVGSGRYAKTNALLFSPSDIKRSDPALVQVVEELGDAANGMCASLKIDEVPEGTLYRIDEYDGSETVQTMDSYDWTVA